MGGRPSAGPDGAEPHRHDTADDYHAVFQATGDGVIIADMDGNLVDVNPALCRMHGYSREEMLRLYPTEFIHPGYHGIFTEYMASLKEGRPYRTTALDVRKDGTTFPVEVNGTVFTYGGKRCVLGVVRDITEQVKAQELLEQRVEDRTRELRSLLELTRTFGSTLELEPLLGAILDELKTVIDYGTAGILVVESDTVQVLGFRGPMPHTHLRTPMPVSSWPEWESLARGETVIIDGPGGSREQFLLRSYLAVPMAIRDRVVGGLSASHAQAQYFTEHHASLLQSFASAAAIAIENARLYEQAQELAILEERQRLSRDLHDSVSQALYGIGLAAETTRKLLPREPARAMQSNEMVQSLAESGMAEMRALLFELRPESLALEGLVAALEKQSHAVEARYQILVMMTVGEEPEISLPAKEALYRIAQEAMQNAVKHAHPARIELSLGAGENEILLDVRDDGRGFDPDRSFPGHLGLHTMRERATRLGGSLEIESAPGQGTLVRVRVPLTVRP